MQPNSDVVSTQWEDLFNDALLTLLLPGKVGQASLRIRLPGHDGGLLLGLRVVHEEHLHLLIVQQSLECLCALLDIISVGLQESLDPPFAELHICWVAGLHHHLSRLRLANNPRLLLNCGLPSVLTAR